MHFEDETEMDVKEIIYEYMGRIKMAQEKVQWWCVHSNDPKGSIQYINLQPG
jgi:hypothetical protein